MDSDYDKIVMLRSMGYSFEQISRLYGVTRQRIQQITSKKVPYFFQTKKISKMGTTKEERLAYFRNRQKRYYLNNKEKVRAINKRSSEKHKEKNAARNILNEAVRGGKLHKPLSCSVCNMSGKKIEGHHKDYSKPLEVVWLCTLCHNQEHKNMLT